MHTATYGRSKEVQTNKNIYSKKLHKTLKFAQRWLNSARELTITHLLCKRKKLSPNSSLPLRPMEKEAPLQPTKTPYKDFTSNFLDVEVRQYKAFSPSASPYIHQISKHPNEPLTPPSPNHITHNEKQYDKISSLSILK